MQNEQLERGRGPSAQHENYRQNSQAPFGYMLVIEFIIARTKQCASSMVAGAKPACAAECCSCGQGEYSLKNGQQITRGGQRMPLAFPMRSHRSRIAVHVRNRRATRGGMMGGSLVRSCSCIGQSCAAGREATDLQSGHGHADLTGADPPHYWG